MSYQLLTYRTALHPRAGLLIDGRVYDAAEVTENDVYATVLGALEDWDAAQPAFERAVVSVARSGRASFALAETLLEAPVLYPGAIYGAGANYLDHVQEMNHALGLDDGPTLKDAGEQPWHFLKSGRSCVVGPDSMVALPAYSQAIDWEIELVAVMGRTAKNVCVDVALDYVAGYTIANDLSSRDTLKRQKTPSSNPFSTDWVSAKNFDGACPIGPYITPAKAVPDPQRLAMKLWVGDELMQDSSTSQMIFSIAEQIAALSSRVSLQPGDLILTGTPAGVGVPRQRFLKPGESVRLWIERIGEFSHRLL